MKLSDINIRDPFVLLHEGVHYLYGTRGATCWGEADGFDVYVSRDLETWSDAIECFHNDGSFFATKNYWAPEVYFVKGAFYMFASFKGENMCRGTAVLKAESPMGPFRLHSDKTVTPRDWECLDGTLYQDRNGDCYMVFCHEWVQAGDGEMAYIRLKDDLSAAVGEAKVLFRASEAPWTKRVRHSSGKEGYVTDRPFLWRTADGTLLMLWASLSEGGYTQGVAVSDNGEITGRFSQLPPLFEKDGGHGMVFRDLQGQLWLTLHSPNEHLQERPVFFPLREEKGERIRM